MIEDFLRSIRKYYFNMPLLVRNFIGKSYSILPFNIRLGKEYSQFRTILLQSRKWSKQEIYNYQFQEIKKIIEIVESSNENLPNGFGKMLYEQIIILKYNRLSQK